MDVNALIATAERLGPSQDVPAEIAEYEDDSNPEVKGLAFRVETLQTADWCLRRIAECEAESAEVDRQAAEAIAAIGKRAADLKEKAERGAAYFRFQVARFAEEQRDSLLKGKKKSVDCIHGRIQFRSSPERLKVVDKDALADWLASQPVEAGLYRVKLEPEMRALQDQFKSTGEVPPGTEVEVSRESITITAQAPEAALMRKGK